MKEVNINIEGYNVNGICVGCLNYNRKMFGGNIIQECFKILANIDVPDGLSIQVCWECLAAVQATLKFRDRISHSYDILIAYSQKHTFLNSPKDLCQYATQRLSITSPRVDCDTKVEHEEREADADVEVKTEVDFDFYTACVDGGTVTVEPTIKPEFNIDNDADNDIIDDNNANDSDLSSDEDIQLSKLKKKKERKSKKFKKKRVKNKEEDVKESTDDVSSKKLTRKLKNLPKELVSLYTMTEEEMWAVRNEDKKSAEFTKLKYKCEDCIVGFNTMKLMNDHMNGKHKPKAAQCYVCDVCQSYLLTKENLSSHRLNHRRAYRCGECLRLTTLKADMAAHVRTHAAITHDCDVCHESFSTKSKLTYHKNVCHQEKPQCDCCGKVFANKMTLKYHLKILPQNDKPKEKLYLECKGCNKVFNSKKSYRAHVVIHNGQTYPCPICGKQFLWKRNLSRHTRNHKEKEAGALHECRECGKTFSSRDCYNNHMKLSKRHVAVDALGHVCTYCGKRFATKWCMVDHIDWDHLKKIKYQCSVCFKPFKTAKIMVAHMNNIHEGKKNKEPEGEHLCEICGKSYKTVKRLKGHVWAMHTKRSNTKSFKCSLCPATFTWQTSIYKHTKMMHTTGKRPKPLPPRPLQPIKKQEHYQEMEPRLPYYPIASDVSSLQQPNIVGLVHNIHNMPQ